MDMKSSLNEGAPSRWAGVGVDPVPWTVGGLILKPVQRAVQARLQSFGSPSLGSACSHRWRYAHLTGAIAEGQTRVLAALVAMVNHLLGPALRQLHVQRRQDEIGRHVVADGPAQHTAAPDIQHHGQIHEAHPGWNIGHVGDPQLVRTIGMKAPLNQIRRWALPLISTRRHCEGPTLADAADAGHPHQTRDALSADDFTLLLQRFSHARHAVAVVRVLVDLTNSLGQHRVGHRTR